MFLHIILAVNGILYVIKYNYYLCKNKLNIMAEEFKVRAVDFEEKSVAEIEEKLLKEYAEKTGTTEVEAEPEKVVLEETKVEPQEIEIDDNKVLFSLPIVFSLLSSRHHKHRLLKTQSLGQI